MLSKKIQQALNDQINAEYFSSYLYLSMAAHCEAVNLEGFAHWMRIQSQEELAHALKFFEFVVDRGGRVDLKAIDGPPTSWDSPAALFEATLEHERHVTGRIHNLVDLARAESDHATEAFLQWFVNEQVEEEKTADGILQKLKLVQDAPGGLYLLDRELSQRASAPSGAESAT